MAHVVTSNGVVELVRHADGFRLVHEDGSLLGDWSESEGLQYPQAFSRDFSVVAAACIRSWNLQQPKTIRVRIAVAVRSDALWHARGSGAEEARDSAAEAVDQVTGVHSRGLPVQVTWVEADVPVPESVTVEGEVTK